MEQEVILIALAEKTDQKTGEVSTKLRYGVRSDTTNKYGTTVGYEVMEDSLEAGWDGPVEPLKPYRVIMAMKPKRVANAQGAWTTVMAAAVVKVLGLAPSAASAGRVPAAS